MIYTFRAALIYRIWAKLILLMVAILIGAIASRAPGKIDDMLSAGLLMVVSFITGIMVLVGACRVFVASIRTVMWR
jgi:hypothetical protein